MKKRKIQPTAIIGWKEWIGLPDLGIPAVKSKIAGKNGVDLLRFLKKTERYLIFQFSIVYPID